jgi:hypothetical protein
VAFFYRGKVSEPRKICNDCEQFNRYERHRRLAIQREKWQQQEQTETRQREWERRVALRQAQIERWREQENWLLQQPDRCCKMCHRVQPASAFDGTSSASGFVFYTRCRTCHQALLERRLLPCCLCQRKTPRSNFLSYFNGYALCSSGAALSLCCKECEAAFLTLPEARQYQLIRTCCQRAFPAGQVIYAEVEPETQEMRYIGRTNRPERRHAQHLQDASTIRDRKGTIYEGWYTLSDWIQTLSNSRLKPSMKILQTIEISPLVVEWEQRYIWHGIQQGWNLLNIEAMDKGLVAHIKTSAFNFLEVPFEMLVQQHFFSSKGLAAFLREWYR